jgi:general secretion pathway protein I
MKRQRADAPMRGFTLIEVLVALVIVAFGMGAVLSALSASADNVAALREKTLAQWIALNRVADVRLNLQTPQTGTTEGDVKNFGNGDWHWQQIISAVQMIPGLLQITVNVRRNIAANSAAATAASKKNSSSKAPDWITTVIGFRGDALAASSGEVPDWNGTGAAASTSSSSSSSGGITTGSTPTPVTSPTTPANPLTPGTPTSPGSSSSGGP